VGGENFFQTKDFFYRENGRFQKSSLLEIWREGGEVSIFSWTEDFFTGRGEGAFLGPRKEEGTKREKENKG
jgi:hypothetical protein